MNQKWIKNPNEIEGSYSNNATNNPQYGYNQFKSLIDHTGKYKTIDSVVSVDVKIIDGKKLLFTFIDQNQNKHLYFTKYRQKDGRIFLQNKNFR